VAQLHSPTLHTAGLATAELAINAALRLSPHSIAALSALEGQVIAIECTRPPAVVYLQSDAQGQLLLSGVHEGPLATRVHGTAGDFAELARAEDPAAALINGGLQLEGSSAVLIDMQRVFNTLDIDWEAPLVERLGDVAGHQLAEMLRAALGWTQQAQSRLRRQLDEFAHEEARLAPPRLELEDFYRDVQTLNERSERLAQRVERLRLRLDRLREA
jgi:ubiquinone biosynthesis protein UbiJ